MGTHVSVCMATHNGAAYVNEQINSILDQLGASDELLISDDASTDDTVDVIQQWADPRIQFLGSQRFGSPILNFEYVLGRARGMYIFLSDQDDIWAPNKMAEVLPLLRQYDMVLTDCRVVDQQGNQLKPSFFAIRNSKPGFWHNLRRNSYMGCCMAFRRELLDVALPFPPHIHMHDWWLGLLAETCGRVLFVPKPLIRYRRHGANASPTGESTYSTWQQLTNRFWMLQAVASRVMATNRR